MNEIKAYAIDPKDRNDLLDNLQADCKKKIAVLDGFEDVLLYYAEDGEGNYRAVYCYEDMIEHFARTNHCSYDDAADYVNFNTMRTIPYMSRVGDVETTCPLVIYRIDPAYTTLSDEYFKEE